MRVLRHKLNTKTIIIACVTMICIFVCLIAAWNGGQKTFISQAASPEENADLENDTDLEQLQPDGWDKTNGMYYKKGVYVTGLKKIDGYYYYFKDSGKVQTGWKKVDGHYYYFEKSNKVGKNGRAAVGLIKINGKKYYFNKKGKLQTGMKTIDGKTYYFSTTGKKGKQGAAVSGWLTYKKSCYYFSKKTFAMQKSTIIDGYKINASGKSDTRYRIMKIVNSVTNDKMTNNQKIKALFNYTTGNSWKYKRTYEHVASGWKWYKGWTDDFAHDLLSTGYGNCFRYAAVFGYLVKEATGYDVRIYCGKTPASRGGYTPHGWVTVKINNTWYAFDPDMYKFYGRKSIYYYKPYSSTSRSIHVGGSYTALQ